MRMIPNEYRYEFTIGYGETKDRIAIPFTDADQYIRHVENLLAHAWGGCSMNINGRGVWMNQEGHLIREASATFVVYSRGPFNMEMIKDLCGEMLAVFDQSCMIVAQWTPLGFRADTVYAA